MVREATDADIPALLEMGSRFAAAIRMDEATGYDPESMVALFAELIAAPNGILLVTDGGAAGGLVYPCLFNRAHLTGQELFWWVNPEQRGGTGLKLFKALEQAAKDRGAQSFMVSTMEALNFDAAGRFYERNGYRPSDRNYIKRF